MNPDFTPVQWHCPNCGSLVMGVRNKEGLVKVECTTCSSVMVSRMMGRRHDRIDIYAPTGQTRVGA